MDTVMSLTAYGENGESAVTSAKSEINRLDALFSISSEDGDVFAVNQSGSAEVSEETAGLVTRALEFCDSTGGAFDCTVQPLIELWGFPTQEYRLPSQDEIDQTLRLVDSHQLSVDGTSVSLGQEGMALDLGGIAKGYTSSR
ncbi:MAG: FAD:protein FMN transferase, partial [Butyricicoccaceae bacterium]